MRFDWYSATVPASPAAAVDMTIRKLPFSGLEIRHDKGLNSFKNRTEIIDGMGDVVCTVLHGGQNPLPHIKASGVYTPDVAAVIRSNWAEHWVSRVDSAIDFDGPGAFDTISQVCTDVATQRGLSFTFYGDNREQADADRGRTIYVGSRKSPSFVRFYEKGKELIAKGKTLPGQPPSLNWCRLENEVKPPNKPAKLRAATLTPEEVWGCSPWTQRLVQRANGTAVERVTMKEKRYTDDEVAIYHMLNQYEGAIRRQIARMGSQEAFVTFCEDYYRSRQNLAQRPSMADYEHRVKH